MRTLPVRSVLATIALLLAWGAAEAGTISIAWNPVNDSNVTGYRIYRGTSAGNYTSETNVGLVTSTTLANVGDCTRQYVAVKAINAAGELSDSFSNEINGYAKPSFSSVTPAVIDQNERTTIVVGGLNFISGATLSFDAGVTVHSLTVNACDQLTATITASVPGSPRMTVTNADRTTGFAMGLLTVLPETPSEAPRVTAVEPDIATLGVPRSVRPTVTFSKVMNAATLTASTVRLVDFDGEEVPQASGSPMLSADGTTLTIVPESPLGYQRFYHVRVKGGGEGVRDIEGLPLASDFRQLPGFKTELDDTLAPEVLWVTPYSSSHGVAATVRPTVTFSTPLSAESLVPAKVALLDIDGNRIAQAPGSPQVSANGRTVTIIPAEPLSLSTVYRIWVHGGPNGVKNRFAETMPETFVQIPGFMTATLAQQRPFITGVDPADTSVLVATTTRPIVYFSEAMETSTINPATVLLLDATGAAIAQASGSPALSPDRRTATIIPAAPLRFATSYRVRVVGGSSGVRDLANEQMTATFTQPAGFVTAVNTVGAPRVARVVPPSLTLNVPVDVRPVVTFTEPVNRSTVTDQTVLLLTPTGLSVPQAANSPVLSADGLTATIVPAANLAYATNYKVRVLGGERGIKDLSGEELPGTYTQASGFVTVDPSASPYVGNVAVNPAGTSAEIVWSTASATTARVFYRRSTAVTYQPPVEDPGFSTGHVVRLTGLSPETEYSYFIESTDANGNDLTSPDMQFTTTASDFSYLVIEAEHGRLTTPVRSAASTAAFQGGYVETPATAGAGTAAAPAGGSQLGFFVPEAGSWSVWVRMFGATATSGAWFEAVDGADRREIAPAHANTWEWVRARSYELSEGTHLLALGGYEVDSRADRVLVTNDPEFVPNEQPDLDVTAPAAPLGISAVPGDDATTLRWTNPVGDAVTVVVRYRTDGVFPANPADGALAVTRPAEGGAADSFVHTGLAGGTTYRYGVFLLDASRNASAAAVVQATPR